MISVQTPVIYGKNSSNKGNSVFAVFLVLVIIAGAATFYYQNTVKNDRTAIETKGDISSKSVTSPSI